ncbi:Hypothetical_protein [Hexamita inflata]|uniref:Hypothetical_protein n=1 Tax=Hexamita inflata TaxID=28002 RepID=A0AA86Q7N0_9EUKA|nr:Hypothetical protein HINF_LOCUS38348 [Hexamita inflata]
MFKNHEEQQSLSENDMAMIEKYKCQIKNQTLKIQRNQDLKHLDFINTLKINQLVLHGCKNIIPQLENKTIKLLEVMDCNIQSVKDFQLENLEVLLIYNILYGKLESKTLAQEIVRFQKRKELTLQKCITNYQFQSTFADNWTHQTRFDTM